MYHFVATPMRVSWNNIIQIESLLMKLEENQRGKVAMWSLGSSPVFGRKNSISIKIWSIEVYEWQNYVSACLRTKKVSPFHLGLHHLNPPPKASSYKRDSEVLYQRGKSLGSKQCVQSLNDKGMQTQYEVNNFSRVNFLSKSNSSPPLHNLDRAHL